MAINRKARARRKGKKPKSTVRPIKKIPLLEESEKKSETVQYKSAPVKTVEKTKDAFVFQETQIAKKPETDILEKTAEKQGEITGMEETLPKHKLPEKKQPEKMAEKTASPSSEPNKSRTRRRTFQSPGSMPGQETIMERLKENEGMYGNAGNTRGNSFEETSIQRKTPEEIQEEEFSPVHEIRSGDADELPEDTSKHFEYNEAEEFESPLEKSLSNGEHEEEIMEDPEFETPVEVEDNIEEDRENNSGFKNWLKRWYSEMLVSVSGGIAAAVGWLGNSIPEATGVKYHSTLHMAIVIGAGCFAAILGILHVMDKTNDDMGGNE